MPLPQPQGYLLEHKTGGGCASLFGLPFFLAGLAVIVLTFIPQSVRGGDEIPWFFGAPFGSIFALVGGAIIFGRAGLVIDKNAGTVTKWWGLLVPMKSTIYRISDFDRIDLRKERRRTKNSSYDVYPVKLAGSDDEVGMSEERDSNKGRADAEKLAKFLDLPIHDTSAGDVQIRKAEELDQTVKQKFESGSISNEVPQTPANLKSKIEYDGAALKVESPPAGFRLALLIPLGFLAIFEIFIIGAFVVPILMKSGDEATSYIPIIFALVFSGLPILLVGGAILPMMLSRETITVDRHNLVVTRSWLLKKTLTIPTSELEELYIGKALTGGKKNIASLLGKGKPIIARSDEQMIGFASSLDREEREYILALSKAVVVS